MASFGVPSQRQGGRRDGANRPTQGRSHPADMGSALRDAEKGRAAGPHVREGNSDAL